MLLVTIISSLIFLFVACLFKKAPDEKAEAAQRGISFRRPKDHLVPTCKINCTPSTMDAVLSSIETSSRALAQDVASFGACVWNARAGSDDRWNCFLQTDPLVSSRYVYIIYYMQPQPGAHC